MQTLFTGVATALVTPFHNAKIDFKSLEKLIVRQLESGIDALVVLGTTGEPATLSKREKESVLRFTVRTAKGKTKLVFGCGSPSTLTAIQDAKRAQELGADGLLVITPYYNKCTQSGLIEYYQSVCMAVDIPVIAYGVPSRTGVNILPETAKKLSKIPNFAGIKDASGDMKQTLKTLRLIDRDCALYSGDDELNFPILACGGAGVISVVANLIPQDIQSLYSLVRSGNISQARRLSERLAPLVAACFSEVNPIPVKCALALCGLIENELRPPLTGLKKERQKELIVAMKRYGLEVKS